MSGSGANAFEYTTTLGVRLRDLDPMGHVNNGVYATYLEQARENYFHDVLGKGLLDDLNTVTAKLTLEYNQPIPGDRREVTVGVRTRDVGETSLTLGYEVRVVGDAVARGTTLQVVYDMAAEESRPVPEEWRNRIEAFEQT